MNLKPLRPSMRAGMLRAATLLMLLSACARPIGAFSASELLQAGRPREAWVTLARDADPEDDARLLALHEAALQHAGGAWADSEAAFTRAQGATRYELLPAEVELVARLRATNALALTQDPTALAAALPALELKPPAPGTGAVVVLFERGAAPRARVAYDAQTKARTVTVVRDDAARPARWQLDAEEATAATLVDSLAPKWSAQLEARLRGGETLGQKLGLDPFANMRDALSRPLEWWTPPTDWLVGRREVAPGKHVVTVSTAGGRRAQVVEVVAGRQTFVVVPQ